MMDVMPPRFLVLFTLCRVALHLGLPVALQVTITCPLSNKKAPDKSMSGLPYMTLIGSAAFLTELSLCPFFAPVR